MCINLNDRPCKECPFLKTSLRGYLDYHTIDEIYQYKNSDSMFTCHLTRESEHENPCAGYIHWRNNHCQKSKFNPFLAKLEEDFKDSPYRNECLGFDFRNYHDMEEIAKDLKAFKDEKEI